NADEFIGSRGGRKMAGWKVRRTEYSVLSTQYMDVAICATVKRAVGSSSLTLRVGVAKALQIDGGSSILSLVRFPARFSPGDAPQRPCLPRLKECAGCDWCALS